MSKSSLIIRPTSFEWRLQSPNGALSGQQKAAMVDKMEEIAERIGSGRALLEFSYDTGAVIAKVSAKINKSMVERSKTKAHDDTSKGFKGFLAKALLFRHGLGLDARIELESRLAQQYLRQEQNKATAELLEAFTGIMALAGAASSEVGFQAPGAGFDGTTHEH